MVLVKIDNHMQKKKKRERERLDYYLTPFTKNQLKMSKWIKDLNIRPEIIKFSKIIWYSLSC